MKDSEMFQSAITEKDQAATEESAFVETEESDTDAEMEPSALAETEDPGTGLDPIDWDALGNMKKSEIWGIVEDRVDILNKAISEHKHRLSAYNKQKRAVSKDWEAVKAKFDGINSAHRAVQREIKGYESKARAKKKEIGKIKKIVYQIR